MKDMKTSSLPMLYIVRDLELRGRRPVHFGSSFTNRTLHLDRLVILGKVLGDVRGCHSAWFRRRCGRRRGLSDHVREHLVDGARFLLGKARQEGRCQRYVCVVVLVVCPGRKLLLSKWKVIVDLAGSIPLPRKLKLDGRTRCKSR